MNASAPSEQGRLPYALRTIQPLAAGTTLNDLNDLGW